MIGVVGDSLTKVRKRERNRIHLEFSFIHIHEEKIAIASCGKKKRLQQFDDSLTQLRNMTLCVVCRNLGPFVGVLVAGPSANDVITSY